MINNVHLEYIKHKMQSCIRIAQRPIIAAPLCRHRRCPCPSTHNIRPVKSIVSDIDNVSYYVGQSIILFTMFYCGLNWAHYRDQRKKLEEESQDK